MKKNIYFILISCFFLTIIFVNCILTLSITSKVISQPTNVSIFILPMAPYLEIVNPIANKTYLRNSIWLDYVSMNAHNLWYRLDNGTNISINGPIFFNATNGVHTLFLYANNSAVSSRNVTFYVNNSLFFIYYVNYTGSTRGVSTDFYRYSYEELLNLLNVCIEDIRYGKICFKEPINVPADLISSDNWVDIDSNSKLILNHLELNITALPNFGKPATIWIYNLSFVNPRILRNGLLCPSSICTFESYSSGTLKFSTNSFSYYSAEESPTSLPTSSSGGGGGGGGAGILIKNITEIEERPLVPCIGNWTCTNWTECINGKQTRECNLDRWYCAAQIKPETQRQCNGTEDCSSSFPVMGLDCCLFGICWFKYVICWYWWILIIIILILIVFYDILINSKNRKEDNYIQDISEDKKSKKNILKAVVGKSSERINQERYVVKKSDNDYIDFGKNPSYK